MKYLKIVVISLLMACLALFFYWFLAAAGTTGLVLTGILFPPLSFLLFWFVFKDVKNQVDGLIAAAIFILIAVKGTASCVVFFNWPWIVIPSQIQTNPEFGPLTPFFKLYAVAFNWYGITSMLAGLAISIVMLYLLIKRTKA